MVNFEIYDVTDWTNYSFNTQLPNISRSKGNHAMKSRQLIELNMRNIFLGKSHAKRGAEASFMKNQSSSYL